MRSTSRPDRTVIFLGPTLERDEAAAIVPDAEIRPPAAIGDVYRAAVAGASTVLLIDGLYERVPAVWHKEILWSLSRGIRVLGAASMGALRAAELARFGMVGIGGIFEDFRDGRLVADDEVAVLHQPALGGHRPCSVALVDIRATLAAAVAAAVIEPPTAELMLTAARRSFYADRDYEALAGALDGTGVDEVQLQSFARWHPTGRVHRKRDDALRALHHLTGANGGADRPAAVQFEFAHTHQWQLLVDTEGAHATPLTASAPSGPAA